MIFGKSVIFFLLVNFHVLTACVLAYQQKTSKKKVFCWFADASIVADSLCCQCGAFMSNFSFSSFTFPLYRQNQKHPIMTFSLTYAIMLLALKGSPRMCVPFQQQTDILQTKFRSLSEDVLLMSWDHCQDLPPLPMGTTMLGVSLLKWTKSNFLLPMEDLQPLSQCCHVRYHCSEHLTLSHSFIIGKKSNYWGSSTMVVSAALLVVDTGKGKHKHFINYRPSPFHLDTFTLNLTPSFSL